MKLWQWIVSWYGPIAVRIYGWISGGLESLNNRKYREEGLAVLKDARATVHDTYLLQRWYAQNGFSYRRDKFECHSRPWLTAAVRKGDCEDYAYLSWEILRNKKHCVMALCHGRHDGKRRGHAILLVKEDGVWRVMSNMYRQGTYETCEKAAESVYGSETIDYCFLK